MLFLFCLHPSMLKAKYCTVYMSYILQYIIRYPFTPCPLNAKE